MWFALVQITKDSLKLLPRGNKKSHHVIQASDIQCLCKDGSCDIEHKFEPNSPRDFDRNKYAYFWYRRICSESCSEGEDNGEESGEDTVPKHRHNKTLKIYIQELSEDKKLLENKLNEDRARFINPRNATSEDDLVKKADNNFLNKSKQLKIHASLATNKEILRKKNKSNFIEGNNLLNDTVDLTKQPTVTIEKNQEKQADKANNADVEDSIESDNGSKQQRPSLSDSETENTTPTPSPRNNRNKPSSSEAVQSDPSQKNRCQQTISPRRNPPLSPIHNTEIPSYNSEHDSSPTPESSVYRSRTRRRILPLFSDRRSRENEISPTIRSRSGRRQNNGHRSESPELNNSRSGERERESSPNLTPPRRRSDGGSSRDSRNVVEESSPVKPNDSTRMRRPVNYLRQSKNEKGISWDS